jgi:glucose-1-phosphate cytidylyltransferase
MKVVIFCGGLGVRMGEATQELPKPMITVGGQPILSHIMEWYASWGHTDFVLCVGYKADTIRRHYLGPRAATSNGHPERYRPSGRGRDAAEWQITFLDTGIDATVGERLRAAKEHVGDAELFLCTYGDGLTDAPLDEMIERLVASGKSGLFMSVRPRLSYHVVDADADGTIRSLDPISTAGIRINGGFFVFRRRIFDELAPEEDIMDGAARLARRGDILAYRYDGFWAPMDTMKDKRDLDAIAAAGSAPWRRPVPQLAIA